MPWKSKTLLALAAVMATSTLLAPAVAQGQTTREYFTARISTQEAPAQLSAADREHYRELFRAIDRQDWTMVDALIARRPDGLLTNVARAEYYLHANSPRIELPALQDWLRTGSALPQAEQIGRLSVARGAEFAPDLPYARDLAGQSSVPRRSRPRTVNDGTMPESIRADIIDHISNDDPDGARLLLDGIDAALSSEARAEWRQRIAWSYFIENRDADALAMAQTVSVGSGEWVAEGDFTAGLAAWRLDDCQQSLDAFQRSAAGAYSPNLRAAALYWGSRAATRCRQPDMATRLLSDAAVDDRTMYGMLAIEQLGRRLPDRVESADFTAEDWRRVGALDNVRIAIGLAEIGEDILGSQVLLHQARIGDPGDFEPLSRLARTLGFPQTQLYMALNAPNGGQADPASHFPAPKIAPCNGWQIDPALAFAHILQESNFRADARSPADAMGLMQITPITVRQHAPTLGLNAASVNIFDPETNLAFGQRNLQMLRDDPSTQARLPVIMAAYNAGMTPIRRWESEINDQDDPLLYMEAIPFWETRSYVAIVMRNYWMYERQANAASPTRMALAQNGWPLFPDGNGIGNGRVFMSTGNR